jgi:hypothetical protein
MIKGLTHDQVTGVMNAVAKFKGKISTGYQPLEAPNKTNSPKASGFFRILKQVNATTTLNGVKTTIQKWALNDTIQKELVKLNKSSNEPRRIECMCFDPTPDQMWESYLGKFSSSEGLECKSHGEGTVPIELVYEGDKRVRKERLFDGKASCPYKNCPDYKKNACKEIGTMKAYPMVDLSINPYQFTTRSLNTISSIEYGLNTMYNAAAMAHKLRCIQTGNPNLKFDGLVGVKFTLVHRKIKSGGRDVFVTQIEHSDDFSSYIMKTIRQGIENKQTLMLEGKEDRIIDPVLSIESTIDDGDGMDLIEGPSLISTEDEKEIATDFAADADKKDDGSLDSAAKKMLE